MSEYISLKWIRDLFDTDTIILIKEYFYTNKKRKKFQILDSNMHSHKFDVKPIISNFLSIAICNEKEFLICKAINVILSFRSNRSIECVLSRKQPIKINGYTLLKISSI